MREEVEIELRSNTKAWSISEVSGQEVDEKLVKKEPARSRREGCPGGHVKKLGVRSCVRSC